MDPSSESRRSDDSRSDSAAGPPAQRSVRSWRVIGPGIVVAATGVGAGDLVATLVAGARFGYVLLWAAVAGCVVKIALVEGVGRYCLSTGRTIFHGWRSLGRWTTVYFAIYVVIWGYVYGAAAMTSSALPIAALFPQLELRTWAILHGLLGLVLVGAGRYALFEKVMAALVGIMFVTVVGTAILTVPSLPGVLSGLVPRLPEGSLIYTLGLIGGVGGTITLAAYGYWLRAKGWNDGSWIRIMRLDNGFAYVMTGIFVVAMLIIGAELLHAANIALARGEQGLLSLGDVLEAEYGSGLATLFLVGFWAASFSSLIGVWHGVSLMFADFVATMRGREDDPAATGESSPAFRGYMLWLTFPPMALLFLDKPFGLIVAYAALGSLFMPFLALTALWLLNSRRTPVEARSGWLSNTLLVASGAMFLALCINELVGLF
jgi:Mn2+/Fe2+ NRAMP family transporter